MAKVSKRVRKKSLTIPVPEVYFLKYAFPCAFISLQRGRIDLKTYKRLERAACKNVVLPFKELEKYFPAAFERIKKLSKGRGYSKWNVQLLRAYFWKRHNDLIMSKEEDYEYAPKVLRDLCQVKKGKIISVFGGNAVVRFASGKTRAVMTSLVGDVFAGDEVMVHYGYMVEMV
jgi:hypothetical protein